MKGEKMVPVIVEAVGEIRWSPDSGGSASQNESEPVARVIDEDGNRYIVNTRICLRNGTAINDSIIGLKGMIEVYNFSAFSFNCPTMDGKRGL